MVSLSLEQLAELGLTGATVSDDRETLTIHFVNRDEIWIHAPASYLAYHPDAAALVFNGRVYVPKEES